MNFLTIIPNITRPTVAGRSMERQQYTCPTHSKIIQGQPGRCPECLMDLLPVTKQESTLVQGYHGRSDGLRDRRDVESADDTVRVHPGEQHRIDEQTIGALRIRFYVVLALTVPVITLSSTFQQWLGVDWSFPESGYLRLTLSSLIFFYGGWPLLTGLRKEWSGRSPGVMTLLAVAITTGYAYSIASLFDVNDRGFFMELSIIILTMLLGRLIDVSAVRDSLKDLELLRRLLPSDAHLVQNDQIVDVRTDTLKSGDMILIEPGETVSADGEVIEGLSKVDESMLTGELRPVEKQQGARVSSGAINGEGALKVKVTHAREDSYLSQVISLVKKAQGSESRIQVWVDRAVKWLVIIALGLGITTFIAWLVIGKDLSFAIERMLTVFIICSPAALGLAIPLVLARCMSIAAKNGMLVRNRTAFDNARKISTVIFNKTGTLTTGEYSVVGYDSLISTYTGDEILALAAALERLSEHPIAAGIVKKAKERSVLIPEPKNFTPIPGKGIQAIVDGKKIFVVSPGFLKENNLHTDYVTSAAETTVFIVVERRVAGYVSLTDELRPASREAIQLLHNLGIKTLLITADNKHVARHVSDALGINSFVADVSAHQKLEKIRELQAKGECVAMTGDGANDRSALAEADLGIAVGVASEVGRNAGDIVLVSSNPGDVPNAIKFGKASYSKMMQNLAWAIGYNILALPLAAGALYQEGIVLPPVGAAVLMMISTGVIAINSQLIRFRAE